MTRDEVGLVADIGRVSVRFGLTGGALGVTPRNVQTFHTADHATFTSALTTYLQRVGRQGAVLPSALAIAGAVRGDVVNLTGGRWYISLSAARRLLFQRRSGQGLRSDQPAAGRHQQPLAHDEQCEPGERLAPARRSR